MILLFLFAQTRIVTNFLFDGLLDEVALTISTANDLIKKASDNLKATELLKSNIDKTSSKNKADTETVTT